MTARKDEQGHTRRVAWLTLIAALAVSLILLLFYNSVSNFMCFCSEFSDPQLAEANGDIELPTSARNLRGYTEGVNELFTVIRFEMDPGDLSNFIDNSLCNEPLTPTVPGSHPNGRISWWDADKAEKLMICRGQDGPSRQTILVDVSDPNTYSVYVSTSVH